MKLVEQELAHLYARALVAIARADSDIGLEEGLRLSERIEARCAVPLRLEDLLFESAIQPEDLAAAVGGDPFRGASIAPGQLAEILVADGLAIALAKGHVTDGEAHRLWAFASALGTSRADFNKLVGPVARWLPLS